MPFPRRLGSSAAGPGVGPYVENLVVEARRRLRLYEDPDPRLVYDLVSGRGRARQEEFERIRLIAPVPDPPGPRSG